MDRVHNGLSRADREQLDAHGLVRLQGLVARRDCEAMADAVWQDLAQRHGVRRAEPATWTVQRPWGFQAPRRAGAFQAMAAPGLRAVLDDLMGPGGWAEPPAWGQPLMTFPEPGPWALPAKVWHLDLPGGSGAFRTRIARVFLLLAPVRPQGGGTLVATGSHRLVAQIADVPAHRQSSAEARRLLAARHAWVRDLMSGDPGDPSRAARFMDRETAVDGVPCRVEEMTGEPGDVFLMHPASLHAPAPNALDRPRMALAETIFPKGR
jgi:hypothetical protein